MSKELIDAASHLMVQKARLTTAMDYMARFLAQQAKDIDLSPCPRGGISRLNTRLFMQVHVTDVIEANQNFDQAVVAYLAVKETERRTAVLKDAGAL